MQAPSDVFQCIRQWLWRLHAGYVLLRCLHSYALHTICVWGSIRWNLGLFFLHFGNCRVSTVYCIELYARHTISSIAFHRLPFDIDTTIRCVAMAIFQLYTMCYVMFIFLMILSFFYGILIYTAAIRNDIKSLLNQIDQRSKSKHLSTETELLEYCKTAIGLHARLNRYWIRINRLFIDWSRLISIPLYLQLHASIQRCDEYCHFYDCVSLHFVCVLSAGYDWNGKLLFNSPDSHDSVDNFDF